MRCVMAPQNVGPAGSPLTPKESKLQEKKNKKFEKASARQLYKNIDKGTIENDEMVTKSFGSRKTEDLRSKVTEKEDKISTKEAKRFKVIKKTAHAFQRMKNWVSTGEFKNNLQLLEMAKKKLPESVNQPKHPIEPVPVQPSEDDLPPDAAQKEPVEEPVLEQVVEPVVEHVAEPVVPEPVIPPPDEKATEQAPPIRTKKVIEKKIEVKGIDRLAYDREVEVESILTDNGTAMLQRTESPKKYHLHYRDAKGDMKKVELKVVNEKTLFLNFVTKKQRSFTSFADVLTHVGGKNPLSLIIPG